MGGIEYLRRARQFLVASDQVSREQLQEAARLWWAAMLEYETWSDDLRLCADATQSVLFRHGMIGESINAMNEVELREACESLRRLCECAERVVEPASDRRLTRRTAIG
jgi:hypothetical protein